MKFRLIILALAIVAFTACTDAKTARNALDSAGFTDIETGGYAPLACSEDDFSHTKFTATNPQGKRVSGVVCAGLVFKNATIRF